MIFQLNDISHNIINYKLLLTVLILVKNPSCTSRKMYQIQIFLHIYTRKFGSNLSDKIFIFVTMALFIKRSFYISMNKSFTQLAGK